MAAHLGRHTQAQFLGRRSAPPTPARALTHLCVIRVGITLPQIREAKEICCFPQRGLINNAPLGESQEVGLRRILEVGPLSKSRERRGSAGKREGIGNGWVELVGQNHIGV